MALGMLVDVDVVAPVALSFHPRMGWPAAGAWAMFVPDASGADAVVPLLIIGVPDIIGPPVCGRLVWQPESTAPTTTKPARRSSFVFPICIPLPHENQKITAAGRRLAVRAPGSHPTVFAWI
jgi:hypothetical protein